MPILVPVFTALVIGIADGDTLTVLRDQQPVKIRLAEIDAPEQKQPFGQRSKQSLSDMCFRQQATVTPQTTDRYRRIVARVTCAGIDANSEQVRRGMAWAYTKYLTDRAIPSFEADAKTRRAGLWADPSPIAPWLWRRPDGE